MYASIDVHDISPTPGSDNHGRATSELAENEIPHDIYILLNL